MNKKLKLLLAMLTVTTALGVAAACDSSSTSSSSPSDSSSSSSTPAPKEKYKVRFVDDDNSIIKETELEEGTTPEAPADPTKAESVWYTYAFAGWDKEIKAVDDDVIYKATYTQTKKTHTVKFKVDGDEVASVSYDVDTTKESITPDVSTYDTVEDQDVAWEEFELDGAADKVVNAVRTNTEYTIAFLQSPMIQMPCAAPMKYTVQDRENFQFPDIPTDLQQKGYTTTWAVLTDDELRAATTSDLVSNGINVYLMQTANTYTVTLDKGTGTLSGESTQTVTYDEEYTLPTAAPDKTYKEFLGWCDEDGKFVESETWNIAKNVTLTAKYSDGITFDKATAAPGEFTGSRTQSISVVNMNGGKALQFKSGDTETKDIGVKVDISFLKKFFDYSDVDYVAFGLKLDSAATTAADKIYYGDYATGSQVWTRYESTSSGRNVSPIGVFKRYYISRTAYQYWVNNNVSTPQILLIGEGLGNGQSLYLDNFLPVTEEQKTQDWLSFEYSGGLRTDNGNQPLLYLAENNQWQLGISNIDSTSIKFTNEIVSDGNTALQFTKKSSGETKWVLNHTADPEIEKMLRDAGYIKYDLYVPEGSDASVYVDAENKTFVPLSKGWNTLYAKVSSEYSTTAGGLDNSITGFFDTTCSTYVVDNIRLITADEYNTATNSFETGAVRNNTASDGSLYYYNAEDRASGNWTMAIQDTSKTLLTDIHFDTETVKEGKQSLSFTKEKGYVSFSLNMKGTMYANLKNGFTFWIYSTVAINGKGTGNFNNGSDKKLNGGEGYFINANEWTQVTVTASDINDTGRFLIINGSTAGTYYFDGFEPLPADSTDAE